MVRMLIKDRGMFTEDTLAMLVEEAKFGESDMGLCLSCGETQGNVEGDASGYECEECGKCDVVGLEQALLLADWDGHTPTPSGV